MRAYPRERFSSEVTLTPAMVAAYAHAAGDDNPVHHDPEFAAATRYGRVIASGTHTAVCVRKSPPPMKAVPIPDDIVARLS